ncbi:zinc finger protein 775-like [Gigantopelta aegis]|uniref:zinc finger protein 775-like n=1 Tax=Gigantopelta aegis TaxID=1735272 RepID=UPI001B888C1D|nr:zinc finger protein 775-like [Gigantopelta aegis]
MDRYYESRSGTPTSLSMDQGAASQMDNDEDNSQDNQLEIIIKGETTPNGSLSPYGKQAAREEKRSDNTHDQGSPDSTGGDSTGTAPDLATPVKKKRNSYADSPHKLSCPCCPRSFPWISSLNRHLLTHTGQKPFKCPRCPVTFSTKSNRERHLIRKHGVNMLDPASRQTMDRPYKCHLCVFSSFATESNLLKHYQERHKGEKPSAESYLNLESSLSCTLSDNEGADDFDNSQTPGGSTGTNGSDEEDCKSVTNMKDPTNETFLTDGCDRMEIDLNGNHPESFDADPNKPDTKMAADMNASLMEDEEEDSLDLAEYSSDWKKMQINPERDNYNVDKITQCWKCGLEFPLRKLLVRHLKDHNIDLPFKCYLCDASFEKRQDCLQHQERFHPQDWMVLKEKNGVDSLDRFSVRMDKLVEKHCQGVVAALQGPEKHGPGGVFVAGEEDRGEKGGARMMEDGLMDTMTSDYQQRKVYCSLCPKRFWSLQDLRRHMRSHTGERPFECDVCFKRFTLKHSMMRHRKKHLDSTTPPLSDDDDNTLNLDDNVGSLHGKTALRFHLTNQKKASDSHGQVIANSVSLLPSEDNDLLHNLLGVEVSAIDKMLNSTDSADSAAQMLGV